MSSDGTLVYTLYIDTARNIAFVHILPLTSQFYGARCINLPKGKSASQLNYYTLTLSSDSTNLYAANGALGVIVSINVTDPNVFSDQIISTVHFDAGGAMPDNKAAISLHNGAVFASGRNTRYLGIRNGYETGAAFLCDGYSLHRRSIKC